MRESKAAADDPAVAEQALDLVWMRRRPDVKILGATPQEKVADAAAHEVCQMVELPEPIEDLESVRIDVLARKGVLRAWDDPGRYHSREL